MKKKKEQRKTSLVDTLVIVGNGFDIWQGLNTNYDQFMRFYRANRDKIVEKLGLKKNWIQQVKGEERTYFSDVELVYGDTFDLHELEDSFWYHFEDSLGVVDAERLNAFFGKEDDDLAELEITVDCAKRILTEAFRQWMATVQIEE